MSKKKFFYGFFFFFAFAFANVEDSTGILGDKQYFYLNSQINQAKELFNLQLSIVLVKDVSEIDNFKIEPGRRAYLFIIKGEKGISHSLIVAKDVINATHATELKESLDYEALKLLPNKKVLEFATVAFGMLIDMFCVERRY